MESFIVFSAGYNCSEYICKNLESVNNQTYSNFKHIVVNDGSLDNTKEEIDKYKNKNTVVYNNEKNKKWMYNARTYLKPKDDDVVVLLDLDDWFENVEVLYKLNELYKKTGCWSTYGSFVRTNGKLFPRGAFPKDICINKSFRDYTWNWQAPRTFRGFLWNNIRDEDVRDPNGKYTDMAYDVSIAYPILEMTPPDKLLYIPDILMVYNDARPINVHKINRKRQKMLAKFFASKKNRYKTLEIAK